MKATDRDKKLTGTSSNIISQLHEKRLSLCMLKCVRHDRCVSANYKKTFTSGQEKNCELLEVNKKSSNVTMSNENGWIHYEPVTQVSELYTTLIDIHEHSNFYSFFKPVPWCRLLTCNVRFQCNETGKNLG